MQQTTKQRSWQPPVLCAALLGAFIATLPARAEVRRLTVGIDVNCPSGLPE
jgi:hypothetical protein